jgi:hypothetical protein
VDNGDVVVLKPVDLHQRLVRLEQMVTAMMPASANASDDRPKHASSPTAQNDTILNSDVMLPSGQEDATINSEQGKMHLSSSEQRYVSSDHWAAILDGIAELKVQCHPEEDLGPEKNETGQASGALLLYGCPLPSSRAEILAALPSRAEVDRYISHFFDRLDLVNCS